MRKKRTQKKRRALLKPDDFLRMMQRNRLQFESALPLKKRSDSYEYSHKSLFEFFVAKKLLQFDKEADIISDEKLGDLTYRLKESIYDFGILLFVHEGWEEQVEKQRTVSTILKEYNGDENAKKFLNNIVILFLATGDVLMVKLAKYEEALEYHLKALDISDKVLGKDHPKVADSYISIGKVLNYQGKYEESLECFSNL